MAELIFKDESYKIVGAAMEVHKELGNGFLEAMYQEALENEFRLQAMPFEREKVMHVSYKSKLLKKYYIADFICYDSILVELKALTDLTTDHEAQLINYLKVTDLPLGILINFGKKSLQYKRIINTLKK